MHRSILILLATACYLLSVQQTEAQPPNDSCLSPTPLVSGTPVAFDTTAATIDGPLETCNTLNGSDVWFSWTADCTGTALIDTCGTGFDTVLVAYAPGTPCPPGAPGEIDCSDIGCGGNQSELIFPSVAGATYLIKVNGWSGATGVGTLTASCFTGSPPNDGCTTPTPLVTGTAESFNTLTATPDGPGGSCNFSTSNADIWYSWTAQCDGVAYFSTCGSSFDTVVTVYSGGVSCSPTQSDEIACGRGPSIQCTNVFGAEIAIPTTAGEVYLVSVEGWDSAVGIGQIIAECKPHALPALSCSGDPGNAETVHLSWSFPPSQPMGYSSGATIEVSGAVTDSIPLTGTETTATYVAPIGTAGLVTFTYAGSVPTGTSLPTGCSIGLNTIPGDNCSQAVVASVGLNSFDNTMATIDGPPTSCTTFPGATSGEDSDVWFEFTPPTTTDYTFSLCANTLDTVLGIYRDNGVCPPLPSDEVACDNDGCPGGPVPFFLPATVTTPLTGGQVYLVKVSGFFAGGTGPGTLNVSVDCGSLASPTCTYDCVNDVVDLSWTSNPFATSYEILRNGAVIASGLPAGTSTYQDASPLAGESTYEIEGTCAVPNGGTITGTCSTWVAPPPGAGTDLILALSGLPGNFTPGAGMNDSAALLAQSLTNLGRTPVTFATPDFDQYACLDLGVYPAIWVIGGTFPTDHRLTFGELNLLAATLGAGTGNIYFESGDHWGFQHLASDLDLRDGVGDVLVDGDDSFTSANGHDAPMVGINLLAYQGINYTPDGFFDFVDHLVLATMDPVTSTEVLWRNDDDTMTGELPYITGVAAESPDGSIMISHSFEIGGLPAADRDAIVQAYVDVLRPPVPPMEQFRRGDCNGDAATNIADAVTVLTVLFPQGCTPGVDCPEFACPDACDTNDDGANNIADAVTVLNVLFPQGCTPGVDCPTFPDPGSVNCGADPTLDTLSNCVYTCP